MKISLTCVHLAATCDTPQSPISQSWSHLLWIVPRPPAAVWMHCVSSAANFGSAVVALSKSGPAGSHTTSHEYIELMVNSRWVEISCYIRLQWTFSINCGPKSFPDCGIRRAPKLKPNKKAVHDEKRFRCKANSFAVRISAISWKLSTRKS